MTNNNPYVALANAEEGSPAHLEAVAEIQARERAYAKSQENVIKGDGRSGHGYASHTIVPEDAVPSNVDTWRGPMAVGEGATDFGDTIQIGDMRTSREVAESLRRQMNPMEWEHLTGLPYQSLTLNPHIVSDQANKTKERFNKPENDPLQDALDKTLELERLDAEKQQESNEEEMDFGPSLLEQVVSSTYSPEMADGIVRDVVASGEINVEALRTIGVEDSMINEAVEHYRVAADAMLKEVNSCTGYLENALTDDEAAAARKAIVAKDVNTLQQLGALARNRIASMQYGDLKEFLTKEERLSIKLRQQGTLLMVTLPKIGDTSWSSAVSNGWVSFK